MDKIKQPVDVELLKSLSPIEQLDSDGLNELAHKVYIETLSKNRNLFVRGQHDHWYFYLLNGKLRFISPKPPVMTLSHESDASLAPLFHQQPREFTAQADTNIEFIRIDSDLLDLLLNKDKLPLYDVKELTADSEQIEDQLFHYILHDYIKNELVIPSMPEVAIRIRATTEDPDVDINTVIKLVQLDPGITARIIQVANSALYSGGQQIASLKQAIERLGFRQTCNLAISYSLQQLFISKSSVLQKAIHKQWKKSARIAAISYILARHTPNMNPEWAFLAGMLHHIGAFPIISHAEQYPKLSVNDKILSHAINRLNNDVSAMILRKWEFGDDIVSVALESNIWLRDPHRYPDYTDIVLAARVHDAIGSDELNQLPALKDIPALKKIAAGKLTPQGSIQVLERAEDQIHEIESLLSLR